MKVYTKQGDTGTTSLVGGTRVPKSDLRLEVYGGIDELNAHLGLLKTTMGETPCESLSQIQKTLFEVGFVFANDWSRFNPQGYIVTQEKVEQLECAIDQIESTLAPLEAFIIPGGTMAAAQAHVARTVCRRCERIAVAYMELFQPIDHTQSGKDVLGLDQTPSSEDHLASVQCALRYLNRLSDYLFVLARTL